MVKFQADVVVLGAGITGLSCARALAKNGLSVVVIEQDKVVGGALRSKKTKNYSIEECYHHVFPHDTNLFRLLKDLKLDHRLEFLNTTTAFSVDRNHMRLTTPQDMIFTKLLNPLDKVRLARLLVKIKMAKDLRSLDRIPAHDWIIRHSSRRVYDRFFRPLLMAKYGPHAKEISAAWFVSRIKLRTNRSFKGENLGYLKGGFQGLLDALVGDVKKRGTILTSSSVEKIECGSGLIKSVSVAGHKIDARFVVSTIPPKSLSKLIAFPQDYHKRLESLRYQGCICLLLGLKKRLTPYYWTNIMDDDMVFKAVIEHTNFRPLREYGEHVVYLASYPPLDSKIWGMDSMHIFERYFSDLQKLYPGIDITDVNWYSAFRLKDSGLVYHTGILASMLPVSTPIPNLFIGGMFNSFPERSIDKSIEIGHTIAAQLLKKCNKGNSSGRRRAPVRKRHASTDHSRA